MKMKFPLRHLVLGIALWSTGCGIAQTLQIDHGPYLQNVTTHSATFMFTTSLPSVTYVEIKAKEAVAGTSIYPLDNGLVKAGLKRYAITANSLEANTSYAYRIHAKHIVDYQPYKIVYGDSICTPWFEFTTNNPKKAGGSFFMTSDMHDRPEILAKLLAHCDYKSCDAFFFIGDMLSYIQRKGKSPYTSFIDTCVNMFASEKPFYWTRGNHETRGNLAHTFSDYVASESGKTYGTCQWGDVLFIILDGGEDKADTAPVYAGLAKFDAFRTEQAEWLRDVVKSKAFKRAKYRIVLSHFPLLNYKGAENWRGCKDAGDKLMPILNKAKIDILIAGHTHRLKFNDKATLNNNFPVLEQGHKTATRLDIKDGKIQVTVKDIDGKVMLERIIEH